MAGVVIVTGGSRGIGAEICRLAGKAGYSVCVNYQSDREAAQNVAELVEAAGGKAIICGADVAQESDVKSMFRLVDQELGTITALVNNAGIVGKVGKVEELDAERINRIWPSTSPALSSASARPCCACRPPMTARAA
mgnify:CR=1 FL=1